MKANVIDQIYSELGRATQLHGSRFASLHECYAVIAEELDELWDIVRQRKDRREPHHIEKELIQIAAMALKGLASMENFTGSRKEQHGNKT